MRYIPIAFAIFFGGDAMAAIAMAHGWLPLPEPQHYFVQRFALNIAGVVGWGLVALHMWTGGKPGETT